LYLLKRITNIVGFSTSKRERLFLLIAFLFLIVKETATFLYYVSGSWEDESLFLIKTSITTLIIISLFLNVYFKNLVNKELVLKTDKEDHYGELFFIFLMTGIFLTIYSFINFSNLSIFIKYNEYFDNKPENSITLFFGEFISIYLIFLSYLILNFITKWFMFYRDKRTKSYLIIILYLTVYVVISEFIASLIPENFRFIFNLSNFLLLAILGFLIWKLFSKHKWLAALERKQKIKYLVTSLFSLILGTVIIFLISIDNNILKKSLDNYFLGSIDFINIIFIFYDIYLLRILIISIASISEDSSINRRSNELHSYAFLTKFINQSFDKERNEIIDLMTEMALNSSNANLAWTEIYDDKRRLEYISSDNIDQKTIQDIHLNNICHSILTKLETPYLVQSVDEHKEFFLFKNYLPGINSLMAVPVFSGMKRIGSLVVLHEEEFGFDQDDMNILSVFSDNLRLALENTRLMRDSLEKQKYQNELRLARKIQQELLPQTLPLNDSFNVAAFSYPAKEVGGDYYDVIRLNNGNYCFLIADVSGKGLSASFYMAQLKGIVLSIDGLKNSPAEVLKLINKTLHNQMDKKMYITMSCVSIDYKTGIMTMARAGHMPFIVRNGNKIVEIIPKGIGIGLANPDFFNSHIEDMTIELKSGDICLLFTDGINELRNQNNIEYGYHHLKELLSESECSSEPLIRKLTEELFSFSEGKEQHDDMSAIAICFNGN
jgi:sigma-B regulation protein RsbU (phosphoserine phosphatase)